jgi:hypothetical protein
MGREAFIAKHYSAAPRSEDLVPDSDVEDYVDSLLSENQISNVALPSAVGRKVYIRVVRMVLRVILDTLSKIDGHEIMGRQFVLLKKSSDILKFRPIVGATPLDKRMVQRLAARVVADHRGDTPFFLELGMPDALVRRLYEDLVALVLRVVFDISFTFKIRFFGHSLTCTIKPDDMLHQAPGWDLSLDSGTFGRFPIDEVRIWARSFVQDMLSKDEATRMDELPLTVQEGIHTRAVLVLCNVTETALNHSRLHIAGMAFHPAVLPKPQR